MEDKSKRVEYPGISINLTNYSVIVDGQTVDMPPKELELLYFLAASPNQVFTREQLLDQIWGYEYIGDTRNSRRTYQTSPREDQRSVLHGDLLPSGVLVTNLK